MVLPHITSEPLLGLGGAAPHHSGFAGRGGRTSLRPVCETGTSNYSSNHRLHWGESPVYMVAAVVLIDLID